MRGCIQSRSASNEQSVLDHGESVLAHYEQLVAAARLGSLPEGWRAPKWWSASAANGLASLQPAPAVMQRYLRFHDCGKPLVQAMDGAGRSHFPGHAAASAALWQELGGSVDEVWLMRYDMLLHTGSAEQCQVIQGHRLMPGLLFASLAEIHSNAQMFGGVASTSFKIKAKQLDRRGAQLLRTKFADGLGSAGAQADGSSEPAGGHSAGR